jgi:non-canonical purine NTP pyrophosphatase (RdgB/HAM1 family)
MVSTELIFATGNASKLAQLTFVISYLRAPIQLVSARERYGDAARYEEIGDCAASIALRGALAVACRLGVPVVVEDTTFHVQAMDGAPGVRAGHYLMEHGRIGILKALGDSQNRRARITSAVAWATSESDSQVWVQSVHGRIARREWTIQGMPDWVGPSADSPLGGGYNAIFIPWGDTRALSEIPPEEAIGVGYREPNFCALIAFLHRRQRL